MTHAEILERAIAQAITGGWNRPGWAPNISVTSLAYDALDGIPYWQSMVYSADFARALWGTDTTTPDGIKLSPGLTMQEPWKARLQAMVISDDPIEYLGAHLDD